MKTSANNIKEKKRKNFSYSTKLLAAFRNGDRCAMCNRLLVINYENGVVKNIGEAAHIAGEQPGAARYDKHMTDQERLSFKNLIYLCSICHTTIDDIPNGELNYPTSRLHEIKQQHEQKVRKAIPPAISQCNTRCMAQSGKYFPVIGRYFSRFRFGL